MSGVDAADGGQVLENKPVSLHTPRKPWPQGALQAKLGWFKALNRDDQIAFARRYAEALDIRAANHHMPVRLLSGGNQKPTAKPAHATTGGSLHPPSALLPWQRCCSVTGRCKAHQRHVAGRPVLRQPDGRSKRDAPVAIRAVAIRAVGMTVVSAIKGIDLSVGAVMAIWGGCRGGASPPESRPPSQCWRPLARGFLCGLWNGCSQAGASRSR